MGGGMADGELAGRGSEAGGLRSRLPGPLDPPPA
jgi:hypothetical protein